MLKRLDSSNEMPVVWRDGPPCTRVGRKGRYSGVSDVGQLPKELQKDVEDIMERVGASCWDVTRGLFTLPTREVRNALRAPEGLDVDQSMCHCYAQRSRHAPEDTPKLRHYIENRTECEAFLDDRDLAKDVPRADEYRRGAVDPPRSSQGKQDAPGHAEVRTGVPSRAVGAVGQRRSKPPHPELARQLPPGTLQSVLNEEYERKNTDPALPAL